MGKPNPFLRGNIAPATVKPRITIDVDLLRGTSNLTVTGPLSIPAAIDILMAQLASLWKRFIQDMSKGIVTAAGAPVLPRVDGPENFGAVNSKDIKEPDPLPQVTRNSFEACTDNPVICQHCGSHLQ